MVKGGPIVKRSLIHWCGLLGVVSLISYVVALLFSPLAYPGYDWMAQAVSDLSALDAPSRGLWTQLASLYGVSGIVSIMMVCVFIQGKLNRTLRLGIYLFAVMNWVSYVGYEAFPLTQKGYAGSFQDIMHLVVTALVVLLSISSLILIMTGGYRHQFYPSLAHWAAAALSLMLLGAVGTALVPVEYFGIPERFSVLSATGFNAVLGVYLFKGMGGSKGQSDKK